MRASASCTGLSGSYVRTGVFENDGEESSSLRLVIHDENAKCVEAFPSWRRGPVRYRLVKAAAVLRNLAGNCERQHHAKRCALTESRALGANAAPMQFRKVTYDREAEP